LEYADVVWDIKTLFLINKSENVQIEAGRIYYVFLGIDEGLESYMQFVISCEGFVPFEFLSNNK
jgi:hypothetical protein